MTTCSNVSSIAQWDSGLMAKTVLLYAQMVIMEILIHLPVSFHQIAQLTIMSIIKQLRVLPIALVVLQILTHVLVSLYVLL